MTQAACARLQDSQEAGVAGASREEARRPPGTSRQRPAGCSPDGSFSARGQEPRAGATGRSRGQERSRRKLRARFRIHPEDWLTGAETGGDKGASRDAIAGIPWRDDGGRAPWFGGGDEKCSDWVYSAGRAVRFANQMATRSNVAFISVTECIEIAF